MTLERAKVRLCLFAALSRAQQIVQQEKIEAAFEEFWMLAPTRHDFRIACKGLVMTPDMLFVIAKS